MPISELGTRSQRSSLDESKFKEWLNIFTHDVLYFMPRFRNVPRRRRTAS
jgi:3-phenylpropionate/cinnamic acid dioxygenase small subunit